MKQRGRYPKLLLAAIAAGLFIVVITSVEAHTVPACCIAPHLGDASFNNDYPYPTDFCKARKISKGKEDFQAPDSAGGNSVRKNNKHCQPDHVSPN